MEHDCDSDQIVIGAHGMVKQLQELKIGRWAEAIKTTILRSVRILGRVLESFGLQ